MASHNDQSVPVLCPPAPPMGDVEWLAQRSRSAPLALRDCIEFDPNKLGGVAVLRGTRFSVSQLLTELADGEAIEDIADNYELDAETLSKFLHALAVYLNQPRP